MEYYNWKYILQMFEGHDTITLKSVREARRETIRGGIVLPPPPVLRIGLANICLSGRTDRKDRDYHPVSEWLATGFVLIIRQLIRMCQQRRNGQQPANCIPTQMAKNRPSPRTIQRSIFSLNNTFSGYNMVPKEQHRRNYGYLHI